MTAKDKNCPYVIIYASHSRHDMIAMIPKYLKIFTGFVLSARLWFAASEASITTCGGVMKAKAGVLYTPGFPSRFPFPIHCKWVIHADENENIRLFLTQVYVRKGLSITEYDYYRDERFQVGREELGDLTFDDSRFVIVSNKSSLVVQFRVIDSIVNMHLRVEDNLTDVFGVNLTYTVQSKNVSLPAFMCSVSQCSFLGECFVTSNYALFFCRCFSGFYGDHCQYGPQCKPELGINDCGQGGTCRYVMGATVNKCICTASYTGNRCDVLINRRKSDCESTTCPGRYQCPKNSNGTKMCVCRKGYRELSQDSGCVEIQYKFVKFEFAINASEVHKSNSHRREDAIKLKLEKQIRSHILGGYPESMDIDCTFGLGNIEYVETECRLHISTHQERDLKTFLYESIGQGEIGTLRVENQSFRLTSAPKLRINKLYIRGPEPLFPGDFVTIVCNITGPSGLLIQWGKVNSNFDHYPWINPEQLDLYLKPRGATIHHWVTEVPDGRRRFYTSMLNIRSVQENDAGWYYCIVNDTDQRRLYNSVEINVAIPPYLPSRYVTRTLPMFSPFRINCIAENDIGMNIFIYKWYRDLSPLIPGINNEEAEDLQPVGSWLVIRRAMTSANYTCLVNYHRLSSNMTVYLYVVDSEGNNTLSCAELTEEFFYNGEVTNITWNYTILGGTDIHLCPYPRFVEGYISRQCLLSENKRPEWSPTNALNCTSLYLFDIQQQFGAVKAGLVNIPLSQVLENLLQARLKFPRITGDLRFTFALLRRILEYSSKYTMEYISIEVVFQLMSSLLQPPLPNSLESKEIKIIETLLLIIPEFMKLYETQLSLQPRNNISTSRINFLLSKDKQLSLIIGLNGTLSNTHGKRNQKSNTSEEQRVYIFSINNITDNIAIQADRFNSTHFLEPIVAVFTPATPPSQFVVTISFSVTDVVRFQHNGYTIECVQLSGKKNFMDTSWVLIEKSLEQEKIICSSFSPGVFSLVAIKYIKEQVPKLNEGSALLLIMIGTIILVSFAGVAAFIHLLSIRHYREDCQYVIHMSLIICITANAVMLLICLSSNLTANICLIGRITWFYFFIASLIFLCLSVFSRVTCLVSRLFQWLCVWKISLIGFGLPFVGVISLVASEIPNLSQSAYCTQTCEMVVTTSTVYILATTIPVALITMTYLVLCIVVITEARRLPKAKYKSALSNEVFGLSRSTTVYLCLLISSCMGTLAVKRDDSEYSRVYLAVNIIMSMLLLSLRCTCLNSRLTTTPRTSSTVNGNNRRAIISDDTAEDYIQHKIHLTSLLGSGEYYQCLGQSLIVHQNIKSQNPEDLDTSSDTLLCSNSENNGKLFTDVFSLPPYEFYGRTNNSEHINVYSENPSTNTNSTNLVCAMRNTITDPILAEDG